MVPTPFGNSAQNTLKTDYLNGRDQGEVSNQDDDQLSGHVLHDGPALTT